MIFIHQEKSTKKAKKRLNSSIPKLDRYIVWNAHNTVFCCKWLANCAQAVYFLQAAFNEA